MWKNILGFGMQSVSTFPSCKEEKKTKFYEWISDEIFCWWTLGKIPRGMSESIPEIPERVPGGIGDFLVINSLSMVYVY